MEKLKFYVRDVETKEIVAKFYDLQEAIEGIYIEKWERDRRPDIDYKDSWNFEIIDIETGVVYNEEGEEIGQEEPYQEPEEEKENVIYRVISDDGDYFDFDTLGQAEGQMAELRVDEDPSDWKIVKIPL